MLMPAPDLRFEHIVVWSAPLSMTGSEGTRCIQQVISDGVGDLLLHHTLSVAEGAVRATIVSGESLDLESDAAYAHVVGAQGAAAIRSAIGSSEYPGYKVVSLPIEPEYDNGTMST